MQPAPAVLVTPTPYQRESLIEDGACAVAAGMSRLIEASPGGWPLIQVTRVGGLSTPAASGCQPDMSAVWHQEFMRVSTSKIIRLQAAGSPAAVGMLAWRCTEWGYEEIFAQRA